MTDFFASLYEWFGLNPLFSTNFGDHLRGLDTACNDYAATPIYSVVGIAMMGLSMLFYALYYHVVDSVKYSRRGSWFVVLLALIILDFCIAFLLPYNDIQAGNFCKSEDFSIDGTDCFGFAFSNSIWAAIFFTFFSLLPFPRSLSVNCKFTPWKM